MTGPIWKSITSFFKLGELVFFPSLCELCSSLLEFPNERVVCRSCFQSLRFRRTSFCLCCGRFFDVSGESHFCARCVKKRPPYSAHRSCNMYEDKLREIIILYKYRKLKVLGKALADFVVRGLGKEEVLWWGLDAILPVPIHKKKEKQRGFNQAHIIAEELSKLKNIAFIENQLVKTKETPPQTSLEAEERRKNLKEAFNIVNPEEIRGKVVLLVDDVFTTGSTLYECSLVLKKAGAKEVRAVTLAQA